MDIRFQMHCHLQWWVIDYQDGIHNREKMNSGQRPSADQAPHKKRRELYCNLKTSWSHVWSHKEFCEVICKNNQRIHDPSSFINSDTQYFDVWFKAGFLNNPLAQAV